MAVFAIKIDVIPKKSLEFMQTGMEMISRIQNEKGNICANFYQDIENEYSLFILTEWETAEDLNRHMKSDHFKALQWAISEMTHSSIVNFNKTSECENASLKMG